MKNKLIILLFFLCQASYGQYSQYSRAEMERIWESWGLNVKTVKEKEIQEQTPTFGPETPTAANTDKCLWYAYDFTDDNGVKSKNRKFNPKHGQLFDSQDHVGLVCYKFNGKYLSTHYFGKNEVINKSVILETEKTIEDCLSHATGGWLIGKVVPSFARTYSIGVNLDYPMRRKAMVSFSSDHTTMWIWREDTPEYKEYYKLVDPYEFIPKIDYLYE